MSIPLAGKQQIRRLVVQDGFTEQQVVAFARFHNEPWPEATIFEIVRLIQQTGSIERRAPKRKTTGSSKKKRVVLFPEKIKEEEEKSKELDREKIKEIDQEKDKENNNVDQEKVQNKAQDKVQDKEVDKPDVHEEPVKKRIRRSASGNRKSKTKPEPIVYYDEDLEMAKAVFRVLQQKGLLDEQYNIIGDDSADDDVDYQE